MDSKEYLEKFYDCKTIHCDDAIKIRKMMHLNDFRITAKINNEETGSIVIRSKEQAEQLHFMLGQLLEKI